MGIEISERAVGKNEAEIESNKRTTATENEAHESADVLILFDAVAIINPDQRKVLHVVKDFEQRDPDEKVRNEVVAVPPKADAGDQQHELDRIRSLRLRRHPDKIRHEQGGDGEREKNKATLHRLQNPRLNERTAAGIERVQRVRHSHR